MSDLTSKIIIDGATGDTFVLRAILVDRNMNYIGDTQVIYDLDLSFLWKKNNIVLPYNTDTITVDSVECIDVYSVSITYKILGIEILSGEQNTSELVINDTICGDVLIKNSLKNSVIINGDVLGKIDILNGIDVSGSLIINGSVGSPSTLTGSFSGFFQNGVIGEDNSGSDLSFSGIVVISGSFVTERSITIMNNSTTTITGRVTNNGILNNDGILNVIGNGIDDVLTQNNTITNSSLAKIETTNSGANGISANGEITNFGEISVNTSGTGIGIFATNNILNIGVIQIKNTATDSIGLYIQNATLRNDLPGRIFLDSHKRAVVFDAGNFDNLGDLVQVDPNTGDDTVVAKNNSIIRNYSTITLEKPLSILIDPTTTYQNFGTINTNTGAYQSITNDGIFENKNTGVININNSGTASIFNFNTLINSGIINIALAVGGVTGIYNSGIMTNNGTIITNSSVVNSIDILNLAGNQIDNNGIIIVTNNGGNFGILNRGKLTNNGMSASIRLLNAQGIGLSNDVSGVVCSGNQSSLQVLNGPGTGIENNGIICASSGVLGNGTVNNGGSFYYDLFFTPTVIGNSQIHGSCPDGYCDTSTLRQKSSTNTVAMENKPFAIVANNFNLENSDNVVNCQSYVTTAELVLDAKNGIHDDLLLTLSVIELGKIAKITINSLNRPIDISWTRNYTLLKETGDTLVITKDGVYGVKLLSLVDYSYYYAVIIVTGYIKSETAFYVQDNNGVLYDSQSYILPYASSLTYGSIYGNKCLHFKTCVNGKNISQYPGISIGNIKSTRFTVISYLCECADKKTIGHFKLECKT